MAVHISRSLLQSVSASSPTPFLYQTRTLAPLSRTLYRPFTRELRHQYSTDDNASEKHDGRDHSSSASSAELGTEVASEITSSGPKTENSPTPRKSFLRKRASSIAPSKSKSEKSSSRSKPLQTMTHHEKLIFADLLGQLNIRKGEQAQMTEKKPWQNAQEVSPGKGKPDNINELIAMFDSILDEVQKREEDKKNKKSTSEIETTSQKAPESEATGACSDIPGESDQIRLSDLGLLKSKLGRDEGATVTVAEAVELIVKREAKKIEAELFRAIEEDKGDMGLWEVCKERIFSVLRHLDERPSTPEAGPATAPATADQLDTNAETAEPAASTRSPGPLDIPALVPASPIVARLYPKTLLIAFRLLNTHFPDSQLISQFRSTIKAQGRTSAVLGTSSALYDEMIYFYWHGCHDLPAVISFLHDMDLHGLNPSFKSRELLKDIVRQRYHKLRATQKTGEETDPFWDLPPNRKAFWELAGPGGWLDRLKEHARGQRRTPGSRLRQG